MLVKVNDVGNRWLVAGSLGDLYLSLAAVSRGLLSWGEAWKHASSHGGKNDSWPEFFGASWSSTLNFKSTSIFLDRGFVGGRIPEKRWRCNWKNRRVYARKPAQRVPKPISDLLRSGVSGVNQVMGEFPLFTILRGNRLLPNGWSSCSPFWMAIIWEHRACSHVSDNLGSLQFMLHTQPRSWSAWSGHGCAHFICFRLRLEAGR